jgi:hypothetical protein
MTLFLFRAGILIGISAFFLSCEKTQRQPLTLPGRDEVATVGAARLSMSAFESLAASYPDLLPNDQVRLGLYSLWLVEQRGFPKTRNLQDALRWVRGTLPPELSAEAKRSIESQMGEKGPYPNLNTLKKALNDAQLDRRLEVNPSLANEYGINAAALRGNSG